MPNVTREFDAGAAGFLTTGFPQLVRISGTNFSILGLAFDAASVEAAFWVLRVGTLIGNLTIDIDWYADTATSGDVVFGVAVAAISPNDDTQDVETKAFAAESTVTQSHLGTTGQRLHRATVDVANPDGLASQDDVILKLRRVATSGSDTMTGDVIVWLITVSYWDS